MYPFLKVGSVSKEEQKKERTEERPLNNRAKNSLAIGKNTSKIQFQVSYRNSAILSMKTQRRPTLHDLHLP